MKNKYMTLVALAAAALATSCASDDLAEQKQEQNQGELRTVTLTASVADDNTTRVGMTKDGTTAKFYWHKDDAISALTVNGTSYGNAKFTTTAENGATTATFTGEVTGTVGGYAVYPYSENHTFTSATALTYNLPAEYNSYKPESKIFGTTDDYLSNSTNMPMLGTIASGKISFKHLGGLAVIRIDKMPVAEGKLTVIADQQLAGNFTVSDLSADGAQIATTTASDGNGKVSFTFSGATANGVGVFYLPLATGSYTNMRVEIKDKDANKWWVSSNRTLSIARASVTAVPLVAADMGIIVKNDDGTYTVNNKYKFIDLGLDELWAETNVGATNAADYGTYIARSNIASATSDWGAPCSMPTTSQFQTLKNNCNWEKTTQTNSSNETIDGWTVKSKTNSSSIFLPIAGKILNGSTLNTGSGGQATYWPSLEGNNQYILINSNGNLSSSDFSVDTVSLPVRLVVEKPE